MKTFLTVVALFLLATSLLASAVPVIAPMPAEVRPMHPLTQFPHLIPVAEPGGPLTLERLETMHLSGPAYNALKRLITSSPAGSLGTVVDRSRAATSGASSSAHASSAYHPVALLSSGDEANASSDTLQDAEPSVVAFDKDGATHTVTAAMKYTPNTSIGRIVAHHSSSVPPGAFTHAELPMPTDIQYQNSGDPIVAANVYSGGVWGKRIYCVGGLFTSAANNGFYYIPSGIGLWHSDDGGQNWSYPSGVAWSSGGGLFDDKPTMAVSYYFQTLGDVYVSWIVRNLSDGNSSSLWVSRSTDGGASFENPAVVTFDNVENPALAVDSNSGTIYVVWVNFRYGDIRMASSSGTRGSALYFGAHSVVSSGIFTGSRPGISRAGTVPAARYNFIANRLMVVWHGDGR